MKRAFFIAVLALFATLISGEAWQRLGSEPIAYEGVEPGLSYTRVIVGGWPMPYLYDSMYFSPVNSVSNSGALLGLDTFRVGAFLIDFAFYALLIAAGAWTIRRLRARRPQ
ncbi:MAG TPA: hypothetical protein VGF48_11800 [Thermoanaerobaculia bacterium]